MASTTPKNVVFPEDHDLSHTVQSSNPLSSRRQVKGSMDSFEKSIIIEQDSNQSVNISDLFMDPQGSVGLEALVGDLSQRSEYDPELSVIAGLKSIEASGSFEMSGLEGMEEESLVLHYEKSHRKSKLSDFSGVLNSGSTQSDLNSGHCVTRG
jgi:hypothetical protein